MNTYKNIAVIGAGLMGCGIAQIFAADEEYRVHVYDSFVTRKDMLERIQMNMQPMIDKEVYTQDEVDRITNRITFFDNLNYCVKNADFVVECIPEKMDLKQNLLKELERFVREDCVLATNTSVMSITEIASKTKLKNRVIGTHFWNPPYLIPLVEVVRTVDTDEAVIEGTMALLAAVGKHPIRVEKDVPGFVANRLQHALWREAISIVEHGIADAKTVDEAVKMSFGMRLPVLAPLENADMVGTDLTLSIHSYILKFLENSPEPSPLLKEKVAQGELGFKSGQGFMSWTPEGIADSRRGLSEHLIKVIYGK